jgi:hypothetical protein
MPPKLRLSGLITEARSTWIDVIFSLSEATIRQAYTRACSHRVARAAHGHRPTRALSEIASATPACVAEKDSPCYVQ